MTTAQSATTQAPPPTRRSRRGRRVAVLALAGLVVVTLISRAVVADRPGIEVTGATWLDPAFVGDVGTPDRYETWTVWDAADGGRVAVLVRNPRPWPITVAALDAADGTDVSGVTTTRVAPVSLADGFDPATFELSDSVRVAAGGTFALDVVVSDRCVSVSAGSAVGTDRVEVAVTSLGLTRPATVELPSTFMAGSTVDHEPAADCQAP